MPNLKRTPSTKPAHARTNFDDRISAAAAAKQALLERFRARPSPDDPAEIERQAALKAIADARDARAAERRAAKEAEAQRLAAEAAARKAAELAAAQEAKRQAALLEAERKAARDAKYAARKARR
ncbi:MAG TPA: hypothetical protein DDZ81_07060 [Acetobacteraceae bacterium]|jgi:hypothetical protein|nr:hypothetical protein [Acetobacteraceae bacterium]